MYLMLLNLVHTLKFETNLTLLSTSHNGDVMEPLSESLPQTFNIHPCASYLSICKWWQCQFPQHLQNKKHLATYVRFFCWLFSLQL